MTELSVEIEGVFNLVVVYSTSWVGSSLNFVLYTFCSDGFESNCLEGADWLSVLSLFACDEVFSLWVGESFVSKFDLLVDIWACLVECSSVLLSLDVVEDEFKLSFKDGLFFSVESCCVVEVLGVSAIDSSLTVGASVVFGLVDSFVTTASLALGLDTSLVVGASTFFTSVALFTFVVFSELCDPLSKSTWLSFEFSLSRLPFCSSFEADSNWLSSAALASLSAAPNINVAPTSIEAVPTVNFLIEYLFTLLDRKSTLLLIGPCLLFFILYLQLK